MRPERYSYSYYAAVAVTVILAGLGAAQVASEALDLTRQQVALMGVAAAMLGVLAGFLPRITRPPNPARKGKD
jgi:UDP-N-acetylmuramyl pentapeptide phosphotransferase/UDP-N-acetylglucosamine-1-phosphate transferase